MVGSFGDLIFDADFPISGLSYSDGLRVVDHEIIGKRSAVEVVGSSPRSVSFSMAFARLASAVETIEDKIERIRAQQASEPTHLVIGQTVIGRMALVSAQVDINDLSANGTILSASVALSFREAIDE